MVGGGSSLDLWMLGYVNYLQIYLMIDVSSLESE